MTETRHYIEENQRAGRLRSFGRLASRMTKSEQEELNERLDAYEINLPESKDAQFDLRSQFPAELKDGKLLVEIGMGRGDQIFQRANANPDNIYLGCEVYRNGLRSLVSKIRKQDLKNIRIYTLDAREMLDVLSPQSVDIFMLLYPDPWHKSRHKKRRIVNDEFLSLVHKSLKDDGEFIVATDIVDYAMWTVKEVYLSNLFEVTAVGPEDWFKQPEGWVSTSYEQKALREGRRPWYLTFKKKVSKV